MEDLLIRATTAGLLVALLAGPLGCFVVWQRLAYFGDTLAHSALLGVALSLLLHVPMAPGVLALALLMAAALSYLHSVNDLAMDTILGMLAHVSLASGVLLLGLLSETHIDWLAWLFGDLLAVSWGDILTMAGVTAAVLLCLGLCWKKFVLIAVDAEIAEVDGIKVGLYRTLLLLLMAATIATAIQVVGVLLVTALLIIPATAARNLASSPGSMAVYAIVIGALATLGGLAASYNFDVSVGPAIVVIAFAFFLLSLVLRRA